MEWFHQNQIEAGDPLSIQDNYFKLGKCKVSQLMRQEGNQSQKESVLQRRQLRKILSVQTKM